MISVAMCTYNGGKYLGAQLGSILRQLPEDGEVVVLDDASSDDTVGIIRGFQDPRIRLFINERNYGVVANFEKALSLSHGDYVFLSDQDDVWMPEKVELCMAALRDHELVVHDCRVVDGSGTELSSSFFRDNRTRKSFLGNVVKNGYLGCCMCFRRSLLARALPFPPRLPMHDIWLGQLSGIRGQAFFLRDRLIDYRRHGSNASCTFGESDNSLFKKISYRARILASVARRNTIKDR